MPGWLAALLEVEVPLFFVVILRLAVGGVFVYEGYQKFRQGYVRTIAKEDMELANPLQLKLEDYIAERGTAYRTTADGSRIARDVRMFSWYERFLQTVVLENVRVFALLVTIGEIAVGALLILGLLVRLAAVGGILLVANYLLATWHMPFPYQEFNILILVLLAVFLLVGAGRCLGFDAVLHERFPEIPLF